MQRRAGNPDAEPFTAKLDGLSSAQAQQSGSSASNLRRPHHRYLISCDAQSTTKEIDAFAVYERVFKKFGLPRAIRTANRERPAVPSEQQCAD